MIPKVEKQRCDANLFAGAAGIRNPYHMSKQPFSQKMNGLRMRPDCESAKHGAIREVS